MKAKHFTLKLIDSIKNIFIVVAVYPDFEWVDGKATDTLKGYKLKTVCPSANFDETIIKIESKIAPLDPEKVAECPVTVAFENLEFSSYHSSITGRQEFVGKASGLRVIKDNA